jgi:hypothetical protein
VSFRRHLVRWEEQYGKQGLTIVEVSGGELSTLETSRKYFGTQELNHPVLWDKGNQNHKNYGITSWPTAYLIGADGKVFWEGNPARVRFRAEDVESLKKLIEEHLKAVK